MTARRQTTEPPDSTVPKDPSPGWTAFERLLRVAVALLVIGIVALAAVGLLGVQARTVSATGPGEARLSVEYARIARPGLPVPFTVRVAAGGGGELPSEVDLRITSSYLDLLDENGLDPQPTDTFREADDTTWTFTLADGQRALEVDFDVRVEPSIQLTRRAGTVALVVDDQVVASVSFRTWVMP
jgi:hypothetical protein